MAQILAHLAPQLGRGARAISGKITHRIECGIVIDAKTENPILVTDTVKRRTQRDKRIVVRINDRGLDQVAHRLPAHVVAAIGAKGIIE